MFGIGMPEMIIILVIALIVIGPQKLPDLARSLGKGLAEFKRASEDLKRNIDLESKLQDEKDVLAKEAMAREAVAKQEAASAEKKEEATEKVA